MTRPRVLFVSKPIVPPYRDGTKCLVRDVASSVRRVDPIVMSSADAPVIERASGGHVAVAAAYAGDGAYAPKLSDNLRAALWLALRSRADLWHFVFAPNPRSSAAGRFLSRMRRVPVLQTIASPPRQFAEVRRLVFGDLIVAQSAWTKQRLLDAASTEGVALPRVEVIPPPVPELAERGPEQQREVRERLALPDDAPIFVYPGDLEVSAGAETVAKAVDSLVAELPGAVVVFAYRPKTAAAHGARRALEARLPGRHVRFSHELPDVLSLVAASRAVLFPVDDLWGKVDLPIVLLEAMSLGVPVIALDRGPLSELAGVRHLSTLSPEELTRAAVELERDAGVRDGVIAAQRRTIAERHRAEVVAAAYEQLYLDLLKGRGVSS